MAESTHPPIHAGVAATIRRFEEAFNAGDPGRAAREVYTSGARLVAPGAPMLMGRENLAVFWEAAAQQMGIRRVKLSTLELELYGDRAHEIGQATLSLADGTDVVARYVLVWKQEDGVWRWDIDIWNVG